MWRACARYSDGTEFDEYFEDNGRNENEQEHELEEMLIERHPGCTWYSVAWVYED